MSPKAFLASALCLVFGVGIGVGVRPSKTNAVEPPDMYAGAIRLVGVSDPDAPSPTELLTITPYRVEENGSARQLGEPGEGRRWVIHIDGGRVKVMGTSGR